MARHLAETVTGETRAGERDGPIYRPKKDIGSRVEWRLIISTWRRGVFVRHGAMVTPDAGLRNFADWELTGLRTGTERLGNRPDGHETRLVAPEVLVIGSTLYRMV